MSTPREIRDAAALLSLTPSPALLLGGEDLQCDIGARPAEREVLTDPLRRRLVDISLDVIRQGDPRRVLRQGRRSFCRDRSHRRLQFRTKRLRDLLTPGPQLLAEPRHHPLRDGPLARHPPADEAIADAEELGERALPALPEEESGSFGELLWRGQAGPSAARLKAINSLSLA